MQSKRAVDIDDPSVETLQTLILLSLTFFAHGLGKKAYMTLCTIAPSLHNLVVMAANFQRSQLYHRRYRSGFA